MKRVGNVYKDLYDLDNIINMTNKVLKNTTNKKKVNDFEYYKMEHVINIKNRLVNKNFKFNKYSIFMITDPKYRIIMDMNLEDKIINHLVSEYILKKTFENKYTDSMIATRIGKGTSYGIRILKKYLNKLKNNSFYILKLDIKKYFYNMDHEVLRRILKDNIKDKDALKILDSIINLTNYDYINNRIIKIKKDKISNLNDIKIINEIKEIPLYKYNKGCSIGNQTSQNFGLIYLNNFNHFLKEVLHLKYVINYMDDFIILHRDRDYLNYCFAKIEEELKKYKLELNKKKSKLFNINEGIDFLGYIFYIKNNRIIIRLRNRSKYNFKVKVKNLKLLKSQNIIDSKEYINLLSSYKGLLKYNDYLYYRSVIRD